MIDNIEREDMYYIIIPFLTYIVPVIFTYIIRPVMWENKWREPKKRGSFDKYVWFQYKMMIIFLFSVFSICFILAILSFILFDGIQNNNRFLKVILIISDLITLLLFNFYLIKTKKKDEIIKLKKKLKYQEKIIINIIFYLPYSMQGIVYLFDLLSQHSILLFFIELLIAVLCIIVAMIILDNTSYFEYKYVSFMLKEGIELKNILNEKILKKGSWIIAKDKFNNESRFKYSDIIKIEYKNEILRTK